VTNTPKKWEEVMLKPVSGIATHAVTTIFAATVAAASAWSQELRPPDFENGRACWDGLCAAPVSKMQAPQLKQKSVTQAPKPSKHAAEKQPPPTIRRTVASKASLPPKQVSSMVTAAPASFYRYPMIYRAEAPPPMPPGASRQPYVQATLGVWYWPGADSIKIPLVPGFDPAIDPSKVMQW
jgi:hypothetical protein